MDHDEFARRAEALRARRTRTAYLYGQRGPARPEAVDGGRMTRPCGLCGSCVSLDFFETWLTRTC